MSEQEILQELNKLLLDNFNVKIVDSQRSLFSAEIGLFPRDLVKFVALVEDKFDIRFDESELAKDELDTLKEMASIIYAHMSN